MFYDRWTMRGMLDLDNELKVADEFWDFLGGKNTYKDLLDCFERIGNLLKQKQIKNYFRRTAQTFHAKQTTNYNNNADCPIWLRCWLLVF